MKDSELMTISSVHALCINVFIGRQLSSSEEGTDTIARLFTLPKKSAMVLCTVEGYSKIHGIIGLQDKNAPGNVLLGMKHGSFSAQFSLVHQKLKVPEIMYRY